MFPVSMMGLWPQSLGSTANGATVRAWQEQVSAVGSLDRCLSPRVIPHRLLGVFAAYGGEFVVDSPFYCYIPIQSVDYSYAATNSVVEVQWN